MSQSETSNLKQGVPVWFWIVSVVALLWNLMGLMAFAMQMVSKPEAMSDEPAMQAMLANLPSWYFIVFGVAVIFGTLGCVGLLMRAKWAFPVFLISLFGILAQQFYMYFLSSTVEVVGPSGLVLPMLVLVIAIALLPFSKMATGKGWLK